jgi:hypothetical protein
MGRTHAFKESANVEKVRVLSAIKTASYQCVLKGNAYVVKLRDFLKLETEPHQGPALPVLTNVRLLASVLSAPLIHNALDLRTPALVPNAAVEPMVLATVL